MKRLAWVVGLVGGAVGGLVACSGGTGQAPDTSSDGGSSGTSSSSSSSSSSTSSSSGEPQCDIAVTVESKELDLGYDVLCKAEKDGKIVRIGRTQLGIDTDRCKEVCGDPKYTYCPLPVGTENDYFELHNTADGGPAPGTCGFADAKKTVKVTCARTETQKGPCPPPG